MNRIRTMKPYLLHLCLHTLLQRIELCVDEVYPQQQTAKVHTNEHLMLILSFDVYFRYTEI